MEREGVGMPGKAEGRGREGRKKERRGGRGGKKVRNPLRQFLPTPLGELTPDGLQ